MDEPLRRGLKFGVPASATLCLSAVVLGAAITASLGTGPFADSSDRQNVREMRLAEPTTQASIGGLAAFPQLGVSLDPGGTGTVTAGATPAAAAAQPSGGRRSATSQPAKSRGGGLDKIGRTRTPSVGGIGQSPSSGQSPSPPAVSDGAGQRERAGQR